MAEFLGSARSGLDDHHPDPDPGDRRAAAAGGRLPHLCRAQGDGGDAAAPGARTWSGPFGLLQPLADGLKLLVKETIIPTRRQPGRLPDGADAHLHRWPDRLGGDPVRRRHGARRHQCRHPLSVRDLARSASTASSWPAGRRNSSYAFLGALRSAAQMVSLRGLDRLRHHHRAALRRLAEPDRHRAGAGRRSGSSSRCSRCS